MELEAWYVHLIFAVNFAYFYVSYIVFRFLPKFIKSLYQHNNVDEYDTSNAFILGLSLCLF